MRKSGLQMFLASMGIDINPEEIMAKYNQAKDIMPKLAEFVGGLDTRLKVMHEDIISQIERYDARLRAIEERLNINASDTRGNGVDRSGSITGIGPTPDNIGRNTPGAH